MRGLVGEAQYPNECAKGPGRQSLADRLNERETRLMVEIEEIQKAKLILAKHPEFLELLDSVQRIGIY
jgi:hypothetical protein